MKNNQADLLENIAIVVVLVSLFCSKAPFCLWPYAYYFPSGNYGKTVPKLQKNLNGHGNFLLLLP